jgi:alpha-tubulin suppressor-like RCC1 family protein
MYSIRQTKAPANLTASSSNYCQDQKKALQKFEGCKEYLQKNASSYPSMALFNVRMGMLSAFGSMCKNYTLKVSPN